MRQKYHYANDTGMLIWDVTSILNDIEKNPEQYDVRYLSTEELAKDNDARISHTRAMDTDVTKPLVVAELCRNHLILLDGNHRLFKAQHLGLSKIPCFYLSIEQQQHFIDHFRPAEYNRIVSGI